MPLYRTVSDRGLWKKYQRSEQVAQPQHFHKPHYLDKTKPVVSNYMFCDIVFPLLVYDRNVRPRHVELENITACYYLQNQNLVMAQIAIFAMIVSAKMQNVSFKF